jgi:hypothetical protein
MMRHWILLAAVLVLVGLDARYSGAQVAKKRPNNVVGTIWEFQASSGIATVDGQFRVYRKDVFKGPNKVGYVKPKDDDETTLVITDFPKLNGTVVLRKTRRKPPSLGG